MGKLIDNTGLWETHASAAVKEAASIYMMEAMFDHDLVIHTFDADAITWRGTYGTREISCVDERDDTEVNALYQMDVIHDTHGNNYQRYLDAEARLEREAKGDIW